MFPIKIEAVSVVKNEYNCIDYRNEFINFTTAAAIIKIQAFVFGTTVQTPSLFSYIPDYVNGSRVASSDVILN